MIKAVFLDYTGTIIEEGGPDGMEMLKRCYRNSDMESMEAMLAYWWKLIKNFEAVSYKDSYITEQRPFLCGGRHAGQGPAPCRYHLRGYGEGI